MNKGLDVVVYHRTAYHVYVVDREGKKYRLPVRSWPKGMSMEPGTRLQNVRFKNKW